MKHLILLVSLGVFLLATELQTKSKFDDALQKAKNQNKDIMMMYSAVWCPECEYMKEIVLKDEEVLSYIEKRYIVLTLDIQKDKLPKGYDYIGIPTFFFIDKNGKEKNTILGGDKPTKFLKKLKAIN